MFTLFGHSIAAAWEAPAIFPGAATLRDLARTGSIREGFLFLHQLGADALEWFRREEQSLIDMAFGAAVVLASAFLLHWFVKTVVLRLARLLPVRLPGHIIEQLNAPVVTLFLLVGLSFCDNEVNFPGRLGHWLSRILYAGFIMAFLWGTFRIIKVIDLHLQERKFSEHHHLNELLLELIRRCIQALVWMAALFFIARALFQIDVAALITGAGVAGLAIAFAAQNTIANFFGAMSIITDKTFKEGDRVTIGEASGSVEAVGFRSTRLRDLDGTVWNVPNRVAADSTIRNITERPWLKYTFTLDLKRETPPEKMRQALAILGEILDGHPELHEEKPPIYFFSEFKPYALGIDVILWFQTTDVIESLKMKQEINLAILDRFKAGGLEFAYPTSTNYIITNNNNTAATEGAVEK